jgi:hypothetical protein
VLGRADQPPLELPERFRPRIAKAEVVLVGEDRPEAVAGIRPEVGAPIGRAFRQRLAEWRGVTVLSTGVGW